MHYSLLNNKSKLRSCCRRIYYLAKAIFKKILIHNLTKDLGHIKIAYILNARNGKKESPKRTQQLCNKRKCLQYLAVPSSPADPAAAAPMLTVSWSREATENIQNIKALF